MPILRARADCCNPDFHRVGQFLGRTRAMDLNQGALGRISSGSGSGNSAPNAGRCSIPSTRIWPESINSTIPSMWYQLRTKEAGLYCIPRSGEFARPSRISHLSPLIWTVQIPPPTLSISQTTCNEGVYVSPGLKRSLRTFIKLLRTACVSSGSGSGSARPIKIRSCMNSPQLWLRQFSSGTSTVRQPCMKVMVNQTGRARSCSLRALIASRIFRRTARMSVRSSCGG